MDLYIIRHAEAVQLGENGVNADADRPLTSKGEEQCNQLAAALHLRGVQLELILTSPFLRARQTAQELVDHWTGTPPALEICDDLVPGSKASRAARVLRRSKKKAVALVGHMPDLGGLAGWFIGSKKIQIDFDKAGVAYLKFKDDPDKGSAFLQWLLTTEFYPAAIKSRR